MHVRSRVARRVLTVVATALVVVLVSVGVVGTVVFRNAPEDPLRPADAVFVLGGEHDGREAYGLQLVRDGVAPVLVLSDPYPRSDRLMRRMCAARPAGREVLCRAPVPGTTLGEAVLLRRLAAERGWRTVVVVTWQYHLPRARFIFRNCFSAQGDSTVMRAVPRSYQLASGHWEFTYLYQLLAFGKAVGERAECAGYQDSL